MSSIGNVGPKQAQGPESVSGDGEKTKFKKASELKPGDVIKVPNNLIQGVPFGGQFDVQVKVYDGLKGKNFSVLFQRDVVHVGEVKSDTRFEFVRSEAPQGDDYYELIKAIAAGIKTKSKEPKRGFLSRLANFGRR